MRKTFYLAFHLLRFPYRFLQILCAWQRFWSSWPRPPRSRAGPGGLFPLHWTIVHVVDETSPLYGMTREDLVACRSELLILLSGIDEATSQVVHTRTSYRAEDIEWSADFVDIFDHDAESVTIDVRRLHDTRPV